MPKSGVTYFDFIPCVAKCKGETVTRHYFCGVRASHRLVFCEDCGAMRIQTSMNRKLGIEWVFGNATGGNKC